MIYVIAVVSVVVNVHLFCMWYRLKMRVIEESRRRTMEFVKKWRG